MGRFNRSFGLFVLSRRRNVVFAQSMVRFIGIPRIEIERLLSLPPEKLLADPVYQGLVSTLDRWTLEASLLKAQCLLAERLPSLLSTSLRHQRLETGAMSARTLCNWVLGFLSRPDEVIEAADIHSRVPANAIRFALPHLLATLYDMGPDGALWQKAIALLALPFARS